MPRRSAAAPAPQTTDPVEPLEIVPLTPDRLDDLAGLFGQGGDPRWCWCAFYRVRGLDWTNSTAESNRRVLTDAVATTAREDRSPGLVAYRGGEAVGWMSLGPRNDYDRLQNPRGVLAPLDEKPVWSIVCFVVGKKARGQGVASALLEAGIAYAREHGATLLEAYPADTEGGRISAAEAFKGTLAMFEKQGFDVVARRRGTPKAKERPIVRRAT